MIYCVEKFHLNRGQNGVTDTFFDEKGNFHFSSSRYQNGASGCSFKKIPRTRTNVVYFNLFRNQENIFFTNIIVFRLCYCIFHQFGLEVGCISSIYLHLILSYPYSAKKRVSQQFFQHFFWHKVPTHQALGMFTALDITNFDQVIIRYLPVS